MSSTKRSHEEQPPPPEAISAPASGDGSAGAAAEEAPAAVTPPDHRRLLIFDNPEKKGHRRAGPHEAAPDWPFRLLLAGPPGSGKRNLLLNLIFQLLEPPPSAIHVVHYDPDTIEYNTLEDLGVPIYYYDPKDFITSDNLETPEDPRIGEHSASSSASDSEDPLAAPISGDWGACPLVIIDEVTDDALPPESKHRLERLLNYCSTHRNTSVIYSIQSALSLPPRARRAFDHFCLWPQPDRSASTMAATRAGIPPGMLQELFGLCTDKHDSIWIDCSRGQDDPYRYRLNMLWPIRCSETVRYDDY